MPPWAEPQSRTRPHNTQCGTSSVTFPASGGAPANNSAISRPTPLSFHFPQIHRMRRESMVEVGRQMIPANPLKWFHRWAGPTLADLFYFLLTPTSLYPTFSSCQQSACAAQTFQPPSDPFIFAVCFPLLCRSFPSCLARPGCLSLPRSGQADSLLLSPLLLCPDCILGTIWMKILPQETA